MRVYFRPYTLTPLMAPNRLSSLQARTGIHLKVSYAGGENFADYFPHPELGDAPTELFLETFKYQEREYEQKVFHFLLHDHELRKQELRPFFNHGTEAAVMKIKLHDPEDMSFLPFLEQNKKLRLDANGLFTPETLTQFLDRLPKNKIDLIEYMEDPMMGPQWPSSPIPWARDFIAGSPFAVLIHKPNARFLRTEAEKIIFSSYMGSQLGQWQAYLELIKAGDLGLHHGILTPGLYEELPLFLGDDQRGFRPDGIRIKKIYDELSWGEWKQLCSI